MYIRLLIVFTSYNYHTLQAHPRKMLKEIRHKTKLGSIFQILHPPAHFTSVPWLVHTQLTENEPHLTIFMHEVRTLKTISVLPRAQCPNPSWCLDSTACAYSSQGSCGGGSKSCLASQSSFHSTQQSLQPDVARSVTHLHNAR